MIDRLLSISRRVLAEYSTCLTWNWCVVFRRYGCRKIQEWHDQINASSGCDTRNLRSLFFLSRPVLSYQIECCAK